MMTGLFFKKDIAVAADLVYGEARSQHMDSLGFDLGILEYSGFSTRNIKFHITLTLAMIIHFNLSWSYRQCI